MKTTKGEEILYFPVFKHVPSENILIILSKDRCSDDAEKAMKIGLGLLLESILMGLRYTGEVIRVEDMKIVHIPSRLGTMQVGVVGGPDYESFIDTLECEVCKESYRDPRKEKFCNEHMFNDNDDDNGGEEKNDGGEEKEEGEESNDEEKVK